MTRIRNAVFTLAAGIVTAGMTIPSAAAQSFEPAAQFMPGQPVVVSVADPELGILEIVWAGRIPLQEGRRVRLALPQLEQRGLTYAVSTQSLDPDAAKKHQSEVGRVHTVYIPSPGSGAILGGGTADASQDGFEMGYDARADGLSSEMEMKDREVAGRLRPEITSSASGSGAVLGGSSTSAERDDSLRDGRRNATALHGETQKKHQSSVGRLRRSYIASPATPLLGAGGNTQSAEGGDVFLTIGEQGIQVDFDYDLSDDIVWSDPCVFGGMKPSGSADQVSDGGAVLGDGDDLLSGDGAGSKNVSTSTGTTGIAGA